ncbi:hypothetical protein [Mycobacterium sp. Marseille-P9652]|uniref:hypothetical protein n=1 Tax=Mycobacterium sp. Marseille-P9652 TaxID=2654950 RepID=UPI0012E76B8A|nr:hypothetical protein [Mycobacterium sp. Marseille-P9652]
MSESCHLPRLTRFAVVAVAGAAALSVAACGSSNNTSQTSTSTSTSTSTVTSATAAPGGEAQVRGMIASVAGNSIQVTKEDNGNAAVTFTSTTKITEVTPAALTDVTPGSCVSVRPEQEPQPGQPVTAASVQVSQAVNGACPKEKKTAPGSNGPAPSGSPTTPAPAKPTWVQGAVAFVNGNTVNLTGTDASGNTTQTPVTVNDKTKYTKVAAAAADAVTPGKCLYARGTMDNATLQATSLRVRPAVDNKCPGKPQGR